MFTIQDLIFAPGLSLLKEVIATNLLHFVSGCFESHVYWGWLVILLCTLDHKNKNLNSTSWNRLIKLIFVNTYFMLVEGRHGSLCKTPFISYWHSSGVCNDGNVRLTGGTSEEEGHVEVCMNEVWGSVCDNSWSSSEANVVCRQLGYSQYSEFNAKVLSYIH